MSIPLYLKRTQAGIIVNVHPVVPLIICDAFTRRENQTRVLGTILGTISENEYSVNSCFVVPHKETSTQVSIDTSHHQTLLELHNKVYPKDIVLGWFSSNHTLQGVDSLIQSFYSNIVSNPIHLSVDASLDNLGEAKVTAQISRDLHLKKTHVATEFIEVACRVRMEMVETIGLHFLQNRLVENTGSGPENLLSTMKKLTKLVDRAHNYVSSVVEGKIKGDAAIGRYLEDTLAVIPFVNRERLKTLFHDRLQELILVLYLANLAKAQVAISDNLNTKNI